MPGRTSDPEPFNIATDSKLHGCDVESLKVKDEIIRGSSTHEGQASLLKRGFDGSAAWPIPSRIVP
jgi:hypothetical protein